MELWVRSQEGNVLMPIHSKLELLYDAPKHILIISDRTILGAYESRKRVLEVLDEIQDLMRSLSDSDLKIIQYEMPQE